MKVRSRGRCPRTSHRRTGGGAGPPGVCHLAVTHRFGTLGLENLTRARRLLGWWPRHDVARSLGDMYDRVAALRGCGLSRPSHAWLRRAGQPSRCPPLASAPSLLQARLVQVSLHLDEEIELSETTCSLLILVVSQSATWASEGAPCNSQPVSSAISRPSASWRTSPFST
jgi:hypothetical protein